MRVLVTLQPAWSHVHTAVPLLRALVARGHDLRVAAPPSTAQALRGWGVPAVGIGPDWNVSDVESRFPGFLAARNPSQLRVLAGLAEETLPELRRLTEAWVPDLVVRDASEAGGLLLGADLGVPVAVLGITMAPTTDWLAQTLGRRLRQLARRMGVPLGDDDLARVMAGERWLCPYPASFDWASDEHLRLVHMRPSTFAGSAAPHIEGEPADLYVTLGTVHHGNARLLRTMVEAVAGADLSAVVTCGSEEQAVGLRGLSPRVRVESYVPQGQLMPHVSAVLCHGGFGTVMGALTFGVPVSCAPLSMDHPATALTCDRLGVGRVVSHGMNSFGLATVDPDVVDHADVLAAVRPLLEEPGYRRAAQRVAQEIEQLPDADAVCTELEEVVA